ncbi:hypothetical protein C1646_759925 [Rhizophagus diaphanus]|nr:hypothetical protein C1646_759925 [Rhizophagus diaphanus] [Rhizophagus sp. MUCL 43196]
MPSEDQVVDTVNKYRMGVVEEVEQSTETSKKSQKDNVSMDEVVQLITDPRKEREEEKKSEAVCIPYQKICKPEWGKEVASYVDPKYEEVKDIFKQCGEEMEWEAIETKVKDNNSGIQKWLNVEEWDEENREIDLRNMNEKRETKSPKEKECKKRWRVEDQE